MIILKKLKIHCKNTFDHSFEKDITIDNDLYAFQHFTTKQFGSHKYFELIYEHQIAKIKSSINLVVIRFKGSEFTLEEEEGENPFASSDSDKDNYSV